MNIYLEKHQQEFELTITHLKKELESLRTGRATPALVENILVEAYGAKTPLEHLASITTPEPKTIVIQPWDKNIIKEIEKALSSKNLGIQPVNEGNLIRLTLAPLTEESRRELLKILSHKLEQARISLRNTRDKIKEEIVTAEKNKEITEDDKYRYQKELDEFTAQYTEKIKELGEKKTNEMITI